MKNSFTMQAGRGAAQGGAARIMSAANDSLSQVDKSFFDVARTGDLDVVRA